MSPVARSREAVFSASVSSHRRRRGWTQTDLARAMAARGFGFHQPTIQRIEDGKRPVRLDEAYALAEILDTSVEEMSVSGDDRWRDEVWSSAVGASALRTVMVRGLNTWLSKAWPLCQLIVEVTGPGTVEDDRTIAGIALLQRIHSQVEQLRAIADDDLVEFDMVLAGVGDRARYPLSATPAELELLATIASLTVPRRFKQMSIPELGQLCGLTIEMPDGKER